MQQQENDLMGDEAYQKLVSFFTDEGYCSVTADHNAESAVL